MLKPKIVVTGMGMLTPLGLDVESTWDGIVNGRSGVTALDSSFDASQIKTLVAGQLKNYDPTGTIDKRESRHLDRFGQIAVSAAVEAVRHARLNLEQEDSFRVAVIVGSGIGGGLSFHEAVNTPYRRLSPFTIPKIVVDLASSTIARLFKLRGPSYGIASACATGGDSIFNAANLLLQGHADVALAGGADASLSTFTIACFNACKALTTKYNDTPQTASRPFDAGRDGFVMSEAASILVLETESHARQRGAHIMAELAGFSSTTDAYHVTRPHPEGLGAIKSMHLALESARMQASDIGYVNAHGTSTYWNDFTETMALKKAFGKHAYKVKISSTKSMTGHMLGASGAAEACFSVLAIRDSVVPPTINMHDPDPECDLDYTPNLAHRGTIDAVMSNSFGFGGHNSCLIFKKFDG